MARDKTTLTKRVVDALRPDPNGKDVIHFDGKLPRFGVRVKPSGVKSWVIQYRNKFGRLGRLTIGRVSDLTPEKAREKAIKLRASIIDGADPSRERKAARGSITVAELCDDYLAAGHNSIKASTLKVDRSRIERHVKPLLGSRAVASLTPADLEKFLRDIIAGKTAPKPKPDAKRKLGGQTTGGPGVASRTLGMLGTILERAVRDSVMERNPARGIKRPKDNAYKPPFSFDAIAKVGQALRQAELEGENIVGLRAIRFLLLTGTRRMETLTLTWAMVDHQEQCLRFEDTKSGPQVRPLGRNACDLLASFRPEKAKPGDYVFPGAGKAGYLVGLPKVWGRVAKRAGISDVSIHGLRHWFASAAASMNFSELTIAGLLGHKVKGVTARYAQSPDSALISVADAVSERIAEALERKPT